MADFDSGSYVGYNSKYPKYSIVKDSLALHIDALDRRSYPGSGSTIYDISGNGRHGTIQSGVTFNRSGFFSFNNSSSAYISFPLVTTAITNVTLQALVEMPASEGGTIFYNGSSGGYGVGVGESTFDNAGNDAIGLFQGIRWIDTNIKWGIGWMLVTLTLDASSVPRFFKDDVLLGGFSGTAPSTPNTNTLLGMDIANSARGFSGKIAWAAVYTKQLVLAEISQNFYALRDRYSV